MNSSKKDLYNPLFSHIYIENKALEYPVTKRILSLLSNSSIIEINHYKDVFSRTNQNFSFQKKSPKLILAVKEYNLVYKGAQVCDNFGHEHFYYTSSVMNCVYDCEYCYLQGMYTSANIVIFVNIEDIFNEVHKLVRKNSIYLCISYDTDIMALEYILGYGKMWIEFAIEHSDLTIELRMKSCNFESIETITPPKNVILAWTISPERIIQEYESRTPSLMQRLTSIKKAVNMGWKVRLCFDPLLYVENWKTYYKELVDRTFDFLKGEDIHDVSIGVFRVSKDYLKKMRRNSRSSSLLHYPFVNVQGVYTYSEELIEDMLYTVEGYIKEYVAVNRIYIWEGN